MASLIIKDKNKEYQLTQSSITVGKADQSTIKIDDPQIAPLHFQIIKVETGYKIIALEYNIGTYVNGIMAKEQFIRNGDQIQVGNTTIEFKEEQVQKEVAPSSQESVKPKTQTAIPVQKPPTTTVAKKPPSQVVSVQKKSTTQVSMPAQKRPTTKVAVPLQKKTTTSIQKSQVEAQGGKTQSPRKSMLGRFYKQVQKKKASPIVFILPIVIIIIALLLFVFISPSEKVVTEEITKRIREANTQVGSLEKDGRYDDAIKECEKIIEFLKDKKQEHSIAEFQACIKELQELKSRLKEYDKYFEQAKKQYLKWEVNKTLDLAKRTKDELYKMRLDDVKSLSWYEDYKKMRETIENFVKEEEERYLRLSWDYCLKIISDLEKQGKWSQVKEKLDEYIKNPQVSENDEDQARRQLETLIPKAMNDFDTVFMPALLKLKEQSRDQANDYFNREIQRFTTVIAEEKIEQLKKRLEN